LDKIRLALLGPDFLPNWGGIGTYNVRLTKHLMNKVDIHVFAAKRIFKSLPVDSSASEIPQDFIENNVHFVSESKDSFLYNLAFQRGVLKELPKWHKECHFDVMHSHHAHMGDLLYKVQSQIPSVVTVHTTIKGQIESIIRSSKLRINEMDASERYQLLLSGFLMTTERLYFKRCYSITTVSKWMKHELAQSFHLKNINVIYSGVEPEIFTPKFDENFLPYIKEPIVLFTSSMGPRKGSYILLDAIKHVLAKTKNVHFVFAGSTASQMGALLKGNMVDKNNYTILGYVPYDQLPKLYARASIFVSPSLCDNLPARILEALSCEVPVIATAIAAIPEAVINGEDGLLIPPLDSHALSHCILVLLADLDLRKRLGRAGRRIVTEKFNWESLAEQTRKVYELTAEKSCA
jgi:glycosyltransferase involved in cell wall biosynthesis